MNIWGKRIVIRLAMVGDVMLGRLVDEFLAANDPCHVWGDTLSIFRDADFVLCNLECAMTDRTRAWEKTPKVFYFRTHTQNVASLKCANVKAVTLANNHTLDFGYDGLEDALTTLSENGIAFAGAGRYLGQAASPAQFKLGDITLGVLSFTDDMPEWAAQEERPGIFYIPSPDSKQQQDLVHIVQKAKEHVSFLIVSPHWGPNLGYRVEPVFTSWAHDIIDSGADMVFGHSGHVFRGIEIYRGKPIVYSAGDFVDDYAVSLEEPNDEGFVYMLEADDARPMALHLYPIVIQDFQARLAGTRAPGIIGKLAALSEAFGTQVQFDDKLNRLTIPISHG